MGRILLTRRFAKFSQNSQLDHQLLVKAVADAGRGIVDANLKGCLIKIRIARKNAGKSSGFRMIVAYQKGERAVFRYGFGKNEKGNISKIEEKELEEYGALLLGLKEDSIDQLIAEGKLFEVAP